MASSYDPDLTALGPDAVCDVKRQGAPDNAAPQDADMRSIESVPPPFNTIGPVVIIGAGVGGCAAALALQRAGVQVLVFEKDAGPDVRRQGYGMTLQTSPALRELGVLDAVVAGNTTSSAHFMFAPDGSFTGYFGDPIPSGAAAAAAALPDPDRPRRPGGIPFNVRIPRDALRAILLSRLAPGTVTWGRRLVGFECCADGRGVDVRLGGTDAAGGAALGAAGGAAGAAVQEEKEEVVVRACVLVGADGVRSRVRRCMRETPPPEGFKLSPPATATGAGEGSGSGGGGGGLSYMGVTLILGLSRLQPCPALLDRR